MELLLALLIAAGPGAAPPSDWRLVNPRAIELFEREPKLMRWALTLFDSDRDDHLSILEADRAAREFKRIADSNGNGQVTPSEYRSARDFIVARWVASNP
ncbi:MAG TPA: hypothetical protein VFP53_00035 [Sphingomicrobium sp.]|nr:hypothetical protein [Sphingomicrobium sp.]